MIVEYAFLSYAMGLLLGAIEAWKRKVYFTLIMLVVVYAIVVGMIDITHGTPFLTNQNYPLWGYAITFPCMIIGMLSGNKFYKAIWEK